MGDDLLPCDECLHALAERPDPGARHETAKKPDLGPDVLAALSAAVHARVAAAARWSVRERLPRLDSPATRGPVRDMRVW